MALHFSALLSFRSEQEREGGLVPHEISVVSCREKAKGGVEQRRRHVPSRMVIHLEDARLSGSDLDLPQIRDAPDAAGLHEQDTERQPRAGTPAQRRALQQPAGQVAAGDLGEPVDDVVEGAGADVEGPQVEAVELVGVEEVAREEHGEEQQDVPVGAQRLEGGVRLLLPGGRGGQRDARAVGAEDVLRLAEDGERNEGAGAGEGDEGCKCPVVDLVGGGVQVLDEGDLAVSQQLDMRRDVLSERARKRVFVEVNENLPNYQLQHPSYRSRGTILSPYLSFPLRDTKQS